MSEHGVRSGFCDWFVHDREEKDDEADESDCVVVGVLVELGVRNIGDDILLLCSSREGELKSH